MSGQATRATFVAATIAALTWPRLAGPGITSIFFSVQLPEPGHLLAHDFCVELVSLILVLDKRTLSLPGKVGRVLHTCVLGCIWPKYFKMALAETLPRVQEKISEQV